MSRTALASTEANRLMFADYVFARISSWVGASFQCQYLWRFDAPLPREAVEQLYERLSTGPLSRRMLRPRVPGARPSWVRCSSPGELLFESEAMSADRCSDWAREQSETASLDIEHGPLWRLGMMSTTTGGSVLSLVWAHAVADGMGMIKAFAAAASGADIGCLPDDSAGPPRLLEDVRDAFGRLRVALVGLVRMLVLLLLRKAEAAGPPVSRPPAPRGEKSVFKPTTVIAEFAKPAWSSAARERGGTDNTLLLALTARLTVATGCVTGSDTVPVNLSVSERDRSSRDVRANVLTDVTVPTKTTEEACADLSGTRRETKLALSQLGSPSRTVVESLLQLVFFLPRRLFIRVGSAQPVAACLASNIGVLPAEFSRVGGVEAAAASLQTAWRNVPESIWRNYPPSMGVLLSATEKTVSMNVQHSDPDNPLSPEKLHAVIAQEAARFDLTPDRAW